MTAKVPKSIVAPLLERLGGWTLLGLLATSGLRFATLPRTVWEADETLFAAAVAQFEPTFNQPHPPGYPLLVGLGKVLLPFCGDPFLSLVSLAFVAGIAGFLALSLALRHLLLAHGFERRQAEAAGATAALLFSLSPGMLIHGSLALSDAPALAFSAIAFYAMARLGTPGARALRHGILLGCAAAAAIGCRPQLAVLFAFAVPLALGLSRSLKAWSAAGLAFLLLCLAWFVPLVAAYGGWPTFWKYQTHQVTFVAANDATNARAGLSAWGLARRFTLNPWGRSVLALPILGLAAGGAAWLWRRRLRAAAPWLAFGAVNWLFCMTALDPADGPRYALPAALVVALLAAVLLAVAAAAVRRPALAPAVAVAFGIAATAYCWPLLRARSTTDSPPVQAADWIRSQAPRGSVVFVDPHLAGHGVLLLPKQNRKPIGPAFERYAERPAASVVLWAEGRSGWPEARHFSWPAGDVYARLTRDLYRVVSVSPVPPQRRYATLSGVYPFEPTLARRHFRWLDRTAVLRLHPAGRTAVRLEVALPAGVALAENEVRFAIDGTVISTHLVAGGSQRAVEIPLPARPSVELTVASRDSFRAPEGRQLALQLISLEMVGGGS